MSENLPSRALFPLLIGSLVIFSLIIFTFVWIKTTPHSLVGEEGSRCSTTISSKFNKASCKAGLECINGVCQLKANVNNSNNSYADYQRYILLFAALILIIFLVMILIVLLRRRS